MRAASLQQELHDDQVGDDAAGVLVLDGLGIVVQHNTAAERRLEELGDLGGRWQEGEDLPPPIWTVLGTLKRALRPETDGELNGSPSLRGRSDRWLTLQASLTEPSNARSAESMVIIAPAGRRRYCV